jgi:hypothetical protein
MPTTAGTNTAEILSASWPISGLLLCAWRTMRIIRASVVAADGAGGEQHAAVLHHGAGMNGVAIAFLLRNRFAGHRFIQPGFALAYHAVNRNAIAGGQAQRHA